MAFLYRYLTQFHSTVLQYKDNVPAQAWLGNLFIAGLSLEIAFGSATSINRVILLSAAWALLLVLGLFMQSTLTDFFAQLFHYRGQSVTVFKWFALSWLPITIAIPCSLLSQSTPSVLPAVKLLAELIFLTILFLQLKTVKALYNAKWIETILIFAIPFTIPWILLLGSFSSLAILFSK